MEHGATRTPRRGTTRLGGRCRARARRSERPSLRPVYNATGVVLHTNLGRAPLADAAVSAIQETAGGYCNLEYDIERGDARDRATRTASHCCES